MNRTIQIAIFTLSVLLLIVGTLFEITHWPASRELQMSGYILLGFIFTPLYFRRKFKSRTIKILKSLDIISIITLVSISAGAILKLNHIRLGNIIYEFGLICILILFVPILLYITITQKKNLIKRILIILISLIYLAWIYIYSNREILTNGLDSSEKISNEQIEAIVKTNNDSTIKVANFYDPTLFISTLRKIENTNDYYVELAYKPDVNYEQAFKELQGAKDTLYQEGNGYERFTLEQSVCEQYCDFGKQRNLVVFNDKKEIIDTLHLKQYECLETMIESELIAIYQSDNSQLEELLVIGAEKLSSDLLYKSESFVHDSVYTSKILIANNIKYNEKYYGGYFINNSDTIAITSTYCFADNIGLTHLYVNGEIQDSIKFNSVILDLIAVPLAEEGHYLYVGKNSQPETDWFWNSLLGLDFVNYALIEYR